MSARPHFAKAAAKAVCAGRNYVAHARELNNPLPANPFFFLKPSSTFLPFDGAPLGGDSGTPNLVEFPQANELHHELELSVVIGTKARKVDDARLGRVDSADARELLHRVAVAVGHVARLDARDDLLAVCDAKGGRVLGRLPKLQHDGHDALGRLAILHLEHAALVDALRDEWLLARRERRVRKRHGVAATRPLCLDIREQRRVESVRGGFARLELRAVSLALFDERYPPGSLAPGVPITLYFSEIRQVNIAVEPFRRCCVALALRDVGEQLATVGLRLQAAGAPTQAGGDGALGPDEVKQRAWLCHAEPEGTAAATAESVNGMLLASTALWPRRIGVVRPEAGGLPTMQPTWTCPPDALTL